MAFFKPELLLTSYAIQNLFFYCVFSLLAINIDTNLNAAFTTDKPNAAKNYLDMYTINAPKHSSLA